MLSGVVDTNVLISGLLGGRTTRRVIEALRDRRFALITSPLLIEEFLRVASRPSLQPYLSLRERQAISWFLQTQAHVVVPKHRLTVCRDPKDNLVLEAAVAGRADAVVTGDEDLLVLHPYRGMAIEPPAKFLQRFSSR